MNINDKAINEECCGCGACYNICPKNAIIMKTDEKGFLYPNVNNVLCIDCGLCVKTCDFKHPNHNVTIPKSYAVKHNNENEVKTSRSGAFFMALCDYVLSHNGFVIGCEMLDTKTAIHKVENTKEGINKFKGSKYVQSNTLNVYKECKDLLKNDYIVLFSGTACQVHSLLSYLNTLNINTTNLITCDIVCHGVPSPKYWEYYVDKTEKYLGEQIEIINFRDKSEYGWKAHYESFTTISGRKIYSKNWTFAFYSHLIMRDSCFNCKYTKVDRSTDFTIADYWGIEKNVPEFNDDKGVSLVIVRGKKAFEIFSNLDIKYRETDINNSLQPQLIHPIKKSSIHYYYWKKYKKNSSKAIDWLLFPTKIQRLHLKVRRRIYNKFGIK